MMSEEGESGSLWWIPWDCLRVEKEKECEGLVVETGRKEVLKYIYLVIAVEIGRYEDSIVSTRRLDPGTAIGAVSHLYHSLSIIK